MTDTPWIFIGFWSNKNRRRGIFLMDKQAEREERINTSNVISCSMFALSARAHLQPHSILVRSIIFSKNIYRVCVKRSVCNECALWISSLNDIIYTYICILNFFSWLRWVQLQMHSAELGGPDQTAQYLARSSLANHLSMRLVYYLSHFLILFSQLLHFHTEFSSPI